MLGQKMLHMLYRTPFHACICWHDRPDKQNEHQALNWRKIQMLQQRALHLQFQKPFSIIQYIVLAKLISLSSKGTYKEAELDLALR